MSPPLTKAQSTWLEEFLGIGLERNGLSPSAVTQPADGAGEAFPATTKESLVSIPPWELPTRRIIPKKGRYKDIENNPWGGLPEVLYPGEPANFAALMAIAYEVGEAAGLRYDAQVVMNHTSGERGLSKEEPEFMSSFGRSRASGPNGLTIQDLNSEYKRLIGEIMANISAISNLDLKEFLSKKIGNLLPPLAAVKALHRSKSPPSAPFSPLHEHRLIRHLMRSN